MLPNFDLIQFAVGSAELLEAMPEAVVMDPFSEPVAAFLQALSQKLLKDFSFMQDIVTFAFWCRRASFDQMKKRYADLDQRLGRGAVFHISPSNVPVSFAFSMAAGLLAGNANIVRLPSKSFPQVDAVIESVITVLERKEHAALRPYIALIRYPHSDEINAALSRLCDVRVIWGGDQTVANIRKAPLQPSATEITFPDRYSLCVIDADDYLEYSDVQRTAVQFFNDTYLSDQNACSSPRIVVWLGKHKREAQERFWPSVSALAKEQYHLDGVQSVGKLSSFCQYAAAHEAKLLSTIHDCYCMRVGVAEITADLMDFRYNSGYFYEYDAESLDEILPICKRKLQTIGYISHTSEKLLQFVKRNHIRGVDRIVPVGTTMDFSLYWDGYDLLERMTRRIDVR